MMYTKDCFHETFNIQSCMYQYKESIFVDIRVFGFEDTNEMPENSSLSKRQ